MSTLNRLYHRYEQEEGLDTSTFFGDQGLVDESTLPDATSEEALAMQPPSKDQSDGKEVDEEGTTEEQQPDGKVPLGALQQERQKRQQTQDRMRELEVQNNTLIERMDKLLTLQQQQQQQPPQQQVQEIQIPDFIDDPVGHLEAKERMWQQRFEQLAGQLNGTTQQQQAQQQHQQLVQLAGIKEQEFRTVTPDYDDAVGHFRAVKAAEYAALGLDALAINQQLAKDCTGLVAMAVQRNSNPAELLYNLSKALGYRGKQPPSGGDDGAPPAVPPKAPTSLSTLSADGRAPDQTGRVKARDVANLSNEEFEKLFNSMRDGSVSRPAI